MSEDKELSLLTPMTTLEEEIMSADSIENLNDVIDIFNVNLKKKDILRSKKLNDVQDRIVDQMLERVDKKADEFSNSDLIQFHKVVQDSINKMDNSLEGMKVPSIQINQQVNVGTQEFTRESRARILDVVDKILTNDSTDKILTAESTLEEVDSID